MATDPAAQPTRGRLSPPPLPPSSSAPPRRVEILGLPRNPKPPGGAGLYRMKLEVLAPEDGAEVPLAYLGRRGADRRRRVPTTGRWPMPCLWSWGGGCPWRWNAPPVMPGNTTRTCGRCATGCATTCWPGPSGLRSRCCHPWRPRRRCAKSGTLSWRLCGPRASPCWSVWRSSPPTPPYPNRSVRALGPPLLSFFLLTQTFVGDGRLEDEPQRVVFVRTLRDLHRRALIERSGSHGIGQLTMHRVPQKLMRLRLGVGARAPAPALENAVAMARRACPQRRVLEVPDEATCAPCRSVVPHVLSLQGHAAAHAGLPRPFALATAELLADAGYHVYHDGGFSTALSLAETGQRLCDYDADADTPEPAAALLLVAGAACNGHVAPCRLCRRVRGPRLRPAGAAAPRRGSGLGRQGRRRTEARVPRGQPQAAPAARIRPGRHSTQRGPVPGRPDSGETVSRRTGGAARADPEIGATSTMCSGGPKEVRGRRAVKPGRSIAWPRP